MKINEDFLERVEAVVKQPQKRRHGKIRDENCALTRLRSVRSIPSNMVIAVFYKVRFNSKYKGLVCFLYFIVSFQNNVNLKHGEFYL